MKISKNWLAEYIVPLKSNKTLENDLTKLGLEVDTIVKSKNDYIVDIEFTPNRGDCFSHLGIARELSIIEDIKLKKEKIEFKKSDFNTSDLISVNVTDSALCSRYACRIIKNINVKFFKRIH